MKPTVTQRDERASLEEKRSHPCNDVLSIARSELSYVRKMQMFARVFPPVSSPRYISSPIPFSRGRVPIYLSRIIFPGMVVSNAAPPKNIDFHSTHHFTPPPPSRYSPIYICLFWLYREWIRGVSFFRGHLRRMNSPRYFQTSFHPARARANAQ